jgi:hypothetical protein
MLSQVCYVRVADLINYNIKMKLVATDMQGSSSTIRCKAEVITSSDNISSSCCCRTANL